MKFVLVIVAFVFISISNLLAQTPQNKFVNHKSKGNLEITHDMDCVGFIDLNNKLTPADLYNGLKKCLVKADYEKGYQLFVLAGVYSTFDKFRVADKTAHQAHAVLTMQAMQLINEESAKLFKEKLKRELTKGSSELQKNCSEVRKIGKPSYHPTYMIQHGMSAFSKSSTDKDLVENFDSSSAWTKALDVYLHCPS